MRIRVHQETRFRFEAPVKFVIQSLRLTPRNHDGQHVGAWRIDLDVDCRLIASEDAFGNITHTFSCPGPVEALTIDVSGDVDTIDSAGLLRGAVERLPPELFLRDTPLTAPGAGLRAFADRAVNGLVEPLGRLHALMGTCAETFKVIAEKRTDMPSVGETIEKAAGTPIDLSHVFLAAARHLSIPARFVSGYLSTEQSTMHVGEVAGLAGQGCSAHAWIEGFVPGLGWVGFDPTEGYCPKDSHIRVAVGLDHLDAMPIRAARSGFAKPTVESDIRITSTEQ